VGQFVIVETPGFGARNMGNDDPAVKPGS
jgi:hypothetical protein